jgi:hypothetical protein
MNFDRLKEAFAKLIREAMSQVDYYAPYACKVVKQDNNGNLELQPEVAKLPGLTGVPIRLGIPGAKVEIQAGARVILEFENGDPRFPVVSMWDMATVTKLEITANEIIFNGGNKKVARVGDKTAGHDHGVIFALTASPILNPSGQFPVSGTITINSNDDTINEGADGVKA